MQTEQPFLITDLVSPEDCVSLDELEAEMRVMIGSSVVPGSIPIKIWNTGQPYTVNDEQMKMQLFNSKVESSVESLDASFEGMLNYNPQVEEEAKAKEAGENEEDEASERDENSKEDDTDFFSTGSNEEDEKQEGSWEEQNGSGSDDEHKKNNMKATSKSFIFDGELKEPTSDDDEIDPNGEVEEKDEEGNDDDDTNYEDNYDDEVDENVDEYPDDEVDNNEESEHNIDEEVVEVETTLESKLDKLNRLKLVMSPRVRDFVIQHGTASFKEGSIAEDLDIEDARASSDSQELLDIMNEYNDLISYLDSPAAYQVKEAHNQRQKGFRDLDDDDSQFKAPISKTKSEDNSKVIKSQSKASIPIKSMSSKHLDDKKKKKKKSKKQPSVVMKPKAVAPAANESKLESNSVLKNDLEKKQQSKKKLAEIEEKNRAKLAEMVERRKQEEEELMAQELKAQARRKKFKDSLLEKAMKSRRASADGESENDSIVVAEGVQTSGPTAKPNFLAPTKAFKVQSIVRTAKQVSLTEDEILAQEEEKRERIAALRRKFKEQHKKILMSLVSKNKDEEKKIEEEFLAEQAKKEKYKLKIQKILEHSTIGKGVLDSQGADNAIMSNNDHVDSSSIGSQSAPPTAATGITNGISLAAAGSALAAVRHQSLSREKNDGKESAYSNRQKQKAASANSPEKGIAAQSSLDEEEIQNRKLKLKLQQQKISAQLAALTEAKKAEEAEKKMLEERSRRRKQILRNRLQQELLEGKEMATHDKPLIDAIISPEKKPPKQSSTTSAPSRQANPVVHASNQPSAPAPSANSLKTITKISSDAAEAAIARLSAVKTTAVEGSVVPVAARDFVDWKKKHNVPQDGKVFAMTGWYPCVKQALLDRGWYFNPDPTSQFFNLKWTLRSIDVSQEVLQPWQFTNHYLKNVAITTKAGLIKSLQSLVWLADVDASEIIPRGYDLSTPHEMQAFIDDFRCSKAESILKKFYLKLTGLSQLASNDNKNAESPATGSVGRNEEASFADADGIIDVPPLPPLLEGVSLSNVSVNVAVYEAICSVLEKQLRPYEDAYIDEVFDASVNKLVTDLEWELISTYNMNSTINSLPVMAPESVDAFLREKEETELYRNANTQNGMTREKKRQLRYEQDRREQASMDICKLRNLTTKDFERIHRILHGLKCHHRGQNAINGCGEAANNMWIVKPAAKSRGRGIATFMDLNKLLRYVEAGSGFSTQWVVQKYIENPLIIAGRKFDMRQWVLVTDWNPLTIYFYDEFYARFSVDEYSTSAGDLSNSFIHLVNNSIGKNSDNFNKTVTVENGETIEGYMWSFDSFKKYIQEKAGSDLVTSKIQPRMKEIAKWSLMCASEMIEHRKNSWELYGFDYMVDDDYNAWLIEINSSPACDYSTKVTEVYVQKALVEILAVVFDCKEWEAQAKRPQDRGPKPDTGGWVNIYEGPLLDMPAGSFGTDLTVKGDAIKPKRPQMQPAVSFANKFQSPTASQESNSSTENNDHFAVGNNAVSNTREMMGGSLSVSTVSIQSRSFSDAKPRKRVLSGKRNSFDNASNASLSPRKAPPSPTKAPSSPPKGGAATRRTSIPISSSSKVEGVGSHHGKGEKKEQVVVSLSARNEKKASPLGGGKGGFDDSDDDENKNPAGGEAFNDDDDDDDLGGDDDDVQQSLPLEDKSKLRAKRGSVEQSYVVPAGAKAIPIKLFEVEF